jgi:parvulin-like peptidyl-prolyl isomerase
MKKLILLILVILFLPISSIYCLEDKVVAIVNNEAITKAELDSYISLVKLQIGYTEWNRLEMTDRKALDNLIEDRLIIQEAKRKKVELGDRFIESRLDEMKRKFKSEDEYSDFLERQGLSFAELREMVKEQMLSEKFVNIEVRGRIFVSPSEVTEYYQSHAEDFYLPEHAQIESIYVDKQDLSQEIYAKLKEGADFTQLQSQYSKKSNLGLVNKGQFKKELDDVIFNLKVGEFSQPQEVGGGYYIFLAKDKLPASKKDLVLVQTEIFNMLSGQKFSKRLSDLIEKLKKNSYIVIIDEKKD